MQIHTDSKGRVTAWINILAMVNAFHRGFGNIPIIHRLANPVPLALTFEPQNNSFNTLLRTTTVPSFKSFRSWIFVLSC